MKELARAGKRNNSRQVSWLALGAVLVCGLTASCSSSSDFGTALGLTELTRGLGDLRNEPPSSGAIETAAAVSADANPGLAAASSVSATPQAAFAYPATRPAPVSAETVEAAAQEVAVVSAQAPLAQQKPQPPTALFAEQGSRSPVPAPVETPAASKPGFFASLFGARSDQSPEKAEIAEPEPRTVEKAEPKPAAKPGGTVDVSQAKLTSFSFESAAPVQKKVVIDSSSVASYTANALPGVRANSELFDIVRKSGGSDDSDVDLYEEEGSYQVASAVGMARLAPHGLLRQRPDVNTSCFKPKLVRMLKAIERHYGKPVIVTSGYRSPEHNRRVRGARKSAHMDCAAADIQVAGVSRWELARFARSLPGRGGVGTYCHTASVHVDVGAERDWNWRCRR